MSTYQFSLENEDFGKAFFERQADKSEMLYIELIFLNLGIFRNAS